MSTVPTIEAAAAAIAARLPAELNLQAAIVLGSGLGDLTDALSGAVAIDYRDLPGFPVPSVHGHSGSLHLGRLNGIGIACLKGRAHYYEGHGPDVMRVPIAAMAALGVRHLVLTNAAGSLRTEMGPGRLMMISDHINFAGANPLIGDRNVDGGPIFLNMTEAYAKTARAVLARHAVDCGIVLHEGVYVWFSGPNFETPAEIRAAKVLGGDAVGMSTVPEVLLARRYGLTVAAISNITNLGAGLSDEPLGHEHTIANAKIGAGDLVRLLTAALPDLVRA